MLPFLLAMVRRWFALLAIGGALACAAAACASDDGDLQPQPLPPGGHKNDRGGATESPAPSENGSDSKEDDGASPTGGSNGDAGTDGGTDSGSDQ